MKVLKSLKDTSIILALILLIVFFSFMNGNFFSVHNFINIVNQVVVLGIMAIGMTFVIISGGIDLSVGAQVSLSNIVMGELIINRGLHPVLGVLIGILLCMAIGGFNGILVNKVGIFAMIATLGMMQICEGLSYTICGGMPIFGFPEGWTVIGQNSIFGIPITVIIFLVLFAVVGFILKNCYFGRYFFSVGGNAEASRLSGIPTLKIKIIAYVICGFFTGIATFITCSRLNSALAQSGIGQEMDVITAVVLGGVSMNGGEGKMSGVLAGVLIIGVLNNGLVLMGASTYMQMIIKGIVLLLSLSMDQLKRLQKT